MGMQSPTGFDGKRAFDILYEDAAAGGRRLLVVIRREFDFGNLHQDWAVSVISQATGAFAEVVIDLAQCGLVSSTFFAGLLQLRAHFIKDGMPPLLLRHPDPRVQRNLAIMRLDVLFAIQPRPSAS